MSGIYKAYDIRGVYGGAEWDASVAYAIGRHLPNVLQARRFLIGRDCRLSSEEIRAALTRGLLESGAAVDDLGLATTPMVYFHTVRGGYDASVQITASHNPPNHNGLKISKAQAIPVGYETGLAELERRVSTQELPSSCEKGSYRRIEGVATFAAWLKLRAGASDSYGLRYAVDCSDGMASLIAREVFADATVLLNATPDGSFPHHSPNPFKRENCEQLATVVREQKLDFGIIFDGDADRMVVVDEQGSFVPPDVLIPYLAKALPETKKGSKIVCDIRTSRAVTEQLVTYGFEPVIWKVGHAYAKRKLRELDAPFGGELAGHYYFRAFDYCDSGELAAVTFLQAAAEAKKLGITVSQLLQPVRERYCTSGECNYQVGSNDRKLAAQEAVEDALRSLLGNPARRLDFDGVRLDWNVGWVNVRPSNTEPYLRLIVEAQTQEQMVAMKQCAEEVLSRFKGCYE